MVDEIVYTREALRRSMLENVERLEEAARMYNPEDDMPIKDVAAGLALHATGHRVRDYINAVVDRTHTRADLRED